MNKKDDMFYDEKGFPGELAERKFQAIPIATGDEDLFEDVKLPEILPILTLRNSVIFPGAVTPITVGREKSVALVRAVNAGDGLLGAVLQRNPEIETPTPDDMYRIGTAARILKILEMPNGNLTVILSGLEKIEVGEYIQTEPVFRAKVTALLDSAPDKSNPEFNALVEAVRDTALRIINISPNIPKEASFAIKNIDSQRGTVNFICSNLEFSDDDRQALLEAPGLLARSRKLLEILIREQQLLEIKQDIQSC